MAKEQKTAPDAASPAAPAKPAAASKKKKEFKKKKERRTVPHGLVHVSASFNNTQITITDPDGRVICNSSAFHRLQGLAQRHALCRAAGFLERRQRRA